MLRWNAPSRILTFVLICCKSSDYRPQRLMPAKIPIITPLEKVPKDL
jgi:hypothetical protein